MVFPRPSPQKVGREINHVKVGKGLLGAVFLSLGFAGLLELFTGGLSKVQKKLEMNVTPLVTEDERAEEFRKSFSNSLYGSANEVKLYKQIVGEKKIGNEMREHFVANEGQLPEWDSYKPGIVGKFTFTRSPSKQAELDDKSPTEQ